MLRVFVGGRDPASPPAPRLPRSLRVRTPTLEGKLKPHRSLVSLLGFIAVTYSFGGFAQMGHHFVTSALRMSITFLV